MRWVNEYQHLSITNIEHVDFFSWMILQLSLWPSIHSQCFLFLRIRSCSAYDIYIYKYWLLLLLLLLLLLINFPLYQYSFLLQILQPFSSFRTCCSSSLAFPVWTDVYQYLNKAIDIISVSQILPSSEGAVPHKKWGLLLYSIYPWQCSISVINKPNRFLISAKFVIDISFGLYYHQNSTF